ncbi:FK506-binding protein 2-like [Actinia tenebrosa]|uniref:peptidylprolyl isomerase n=1 Tax=Actinia tenebrosa TaxID=6105 RepID=A0A6P8J857_ACTTE|nr:FK506-binding protein 2-like [Actinia tenebrosa]
MWRITKLVLFSLLFVTLVENSFQDDEGGEEEEFRGLRIGIMRKPKKCAQETKHGDHLTVKYNATLVDGTLLVPTRNLEFTIGEGSMIQGWDQGLLDMCVGEIRELVAPPSYGYGELQVGDAIPPKAHLTFYIELLDIKDGQPKPDIFGQVDINGDGLISHDEVAAYLRKESIPDGDGDSSHQTVITEIFNEEDKDNDGYISLNEFQGFKHEEL